MNPSSLFALPLLLIVPIAVYADPDLDVAMQSLLTVGREGKGNPTATAAWKKVAGQEGKSLVAILRAFEQADATAVNWIGAAVDAIVERELAAKKALPKADLEAFLLDRARDPRARRIAYEILVRVDPATPDRFLPKMLDDPSSELRRDAVQREIEEAKALLAKKDQSAALLSFKKAFDGARDRDQVDLLAKELKGLGVEVKLASHFGFVQKWHLLASFENSKGVGYATAYPPETEIALMKKYPGKVGETAWVQHVTDDNYGKVDLNKVIGKHKGAVGYAFAIVESPIEQKVEFRAASQNAVKMFLNGKMVFGREEYHHGTRMDQHVAQVELKKGRNEILLKICQNEQSEPWAQEWAFQFRICDAIGGGIALTVP
jgi:hypothetical protein